MECTRGEFKGHPMLEFEMATERYPDTRAWGFGVAKAAKVLRNLGHVISFIKDHANPEDLEPLEPLIAKLLPILRDEHTSAREALLEPLEPVPAVEPEPAAPADDGDDCPF